MSVGQYMSVSKNLCIKCMNNSVSCSGLYVFINMHIQGEELRPLFFVALDPEARTGLTV